MNDKKIGRNDPCPCGSGKKYKKCCLEKDREKELVDEKARKKDLKDVKNVEDKLVKGLHNRDKTVQLSMELIKKKGFVGEIIDEHYSTDSELGKTGIIDINLNCKHGKWTGECMTLNYCEGDGSHSDDGKWILGDEGFGDPEFCFECECEKRGWNPKEYRILSRDEVEQLKKEGKLESIRKKEKK